MWPNQHQLLVAIGAEELCVIFRKGFTKNILAKHHESYVNLTSEQAWKAGIRRLDVLLETIDLPQNTQVCITLASDLVRYIILPGHEVAMSTSEKLAYAQAAFREIHGAATDSWKIRIDDTAPTAPSLVSAIDMSMYDTIVGLVQKHKLRLKSVQPYLMTTFNKLFSSVKSANGALVVIEKTRIATLFLQSGVCQQLYIEKLTQDWQTNLEHTISRNQLLTNHLSKELMIYAPTFTSIKSEFANKHSCKRLSVKANKDVLPSGFAMLEALV